MKSLRLSLLSVSILLFAWHLQSAYEADANRPPAPSTRSIKVLPLEHLPGANATTAVDRDPVVATEAPLPTRSVRGARPGMVAPANRRGLSLEVTSMPPIEQGGRVPIPAPATAEVASFSPDNNAPLESLHTPLVITFVQSPPTDEDLVSIVPAIEGRFTWRDQRTLVFTPTPAWLPNTRYEVTVGVNWRTWFRTQRLIQGVFPTQDSALNPRTKIGIQFGVLVDQSSVERAFTISPTVPGNLHWTTEGRVVFEQHEPLDHLTTYQVGFEGTLYDAGGAALPDVPQWSFTTRSAIIEAKPKTHTDVDTAIRLGFEVPVDQRSVEAAFTITPSVPGSFDWDANTLRFTPQDYLEPDTTYCVTLRTTARDAASRPLLLSPYRWDFTTNPIPHTVSFGYGPNIQLLDADGERVVQVDAYASRNITARLYALTLDQFLDRYTSSFRGVGPAEDKPISTRDLIQVLTWEQEIEQRGEISIPGSADAGLYILEVQCGLGYDQLIVALTHHVLVLKQSDGQIVTWASTFQDHAPAAGMHLRFYDRDGSLVAEGATEERGLHRAQVPVDPEPLIVVGERNGDLTLSGLAPEWEDGWGWWGWWQNDPGAPTAKIYPYTDRPIYRPGQALHMRALIRRDDDAVYSLALDAEVVVRLRDARDNVIATRRLTPDAFGAVYADFEIADGGTVGTYHLEVSALGETVRQAFLVEAYRKPDYQVSLRAASDHAIAGETISLTVQAEYFFGAPVSGAQVELLPYVVGYDDWNDPGCCELETGLNYGYAFQGLHRLGTTDANGELTFVLPAQVTNGTDAQTWNIEATVMDPSGLSVSAHTRVVVHRAAYDLSVHTEHYHYRPGEPIPITIMAHDHRGVPQVGSELNASLYAWSQKGGTFSQQVAGTDALTDAEGRAETSLQISQSGWYQLRVAGRDHAGRPVQAESWVWVYEESGLWDSNSRDGLRLSTDRDRYAPGESARLLIDSPVSGPALLSFERGTTRRETVIQLNQGLTTLDFALLPEDVPNIHVAVAVWRPTVPGEDRWRWQSRPEAELLTARAEILVPADSERLTVTITPDRDQYAPRDQASFLVEIRDQDGRPVRAGFSLALVDEAIFALAADQTPHIFDAFYEPRPDTVNTYHSLRPVRWLDGGRGGGGGGADLSGSPRSDFPDTAFWAPALATDADGKAWVTVSLPDSLTRWRAVVRAITVDTKVGQAEADIRVALPLSIQPVLPRFLVQHDQATVTAVVHNHSGITQTATVQLTPHGVALQEGSQGSGDGTQSITLPAHGTVAVGWAIVAQELGQASLRMDVALVARTEEGTAPWHDAVVLSLPILPRAVPHVTTVAADVKGQWAEMITLPDAGVIDISRWELSLAPTIATGMLDGLEFLIDYPFG